MQNQAKLSRENEARAMKSKTILLALIFCSPCFGGDKVDPVFLGEYKLISTEKGECAEAVIVNTKERQKYSLWITYRDETNNFAGNEKFEDINDSLISSTDSCMTAGPPIPFCTESRKEITKYDQAAQVLENFYGYKRGMNNAKYKYTKLEVVDGGLKVTRLEMEKPMAPGVFTMTPVEYGATSTSYYTFARVKTNSVCVYDKQ